jgi:Ca2+-binding EF-hand superfamily protein
MIMKKLAFATLAAMGMTAAAIAQQQPSQQPAPRSTQPSTQQPTQTPSTREATPAPRGGDRTEQVSFETADANGDGRVNRQEANDIEGFDFSRADTNNDASLTRQEFMAAMSTSTPRDGEPGAASARSGQSGAGASSQSNPGAASGRSGSGATATAQVTFDTADKNKDGKVNREEANDVKGLNFSTADVNDDASLSRQEFQTAMAGAQPRG